MSTSTVQFPNLEKMQAMQAKSQPIGEFIEWLGQNGMAICTSDGGQRGERFTPVMASTEELLACHFDVDLSAAEKERRAVLATLRQSY